MLKANEIRWTNVSQDFESCFSKSHMAARFVQERQDRIFATLKIANVTPVTPVAKNSFDAAERPNVAIQSKPEKISHADAKWSSRSDDYTNNPILSKTQMAERLFQERKDRLGDILKIASDATPAPAEQAVKPAVDKSEIPKKVETLIESNAAASKPKVTENAVSKIDNKHAMQPPQLPGHVIKEINSPAVSSVAKRVLHEVILERTLKTKKVAIPEAAVQEQSSAVDNSKELPKKVEALIQSNPAGSKPKVTETAVSKIDNKHALQSAQLPGHVIKEINPPVLSPKHAASSVSPVAKRVLDELILECTLKTKKVAIPEAAVQGQSSAVNNSKEFPKKGETLIQSNPAASKPKVTETAVSKIDNKHAMQSTKLPGHVIKEINPPVMSPKHAPSSVSPLARKVLDELILECTLKTKKVAVPEHAVQGQSSIGHGIKEINPPVMTLKHAPNSVSPVAKKVLDELILGCIYKTKKVAMPEPVVQEQCSAVDNSEEFPKTVETLIQSNPAGSKPKVTETAVSKIDNKHAMQSTQSPGHVIKGINLPVMSPKHAASSMLPVAKRILDELLLECILKTKKIAIPEAAVQEQKSAVNNSEEFPKKVETLIQSNPAGSKPKVTETAVSKIDKHAMQSTQLPGHVIKGINLPVMSIKHAPSSVSPLAKRILDELILECTLKTKKVAIPEVARQGQSSAGHVIKEINPPLMSTKHAASSVSPLAKRILDELILECTSKTKKVTIPGPAMEEQSSAVEDLTEVITPNPSATISIASEQTDADREQGKKFKEGSSKKMKRLRSFLRSLCCVKKESDNLENVAKPKAKKNDGKSISNRGSAIGNLRKRFQNLFSLNAN